jgi:hypothetical protein
MRGSARLPASAGRAPPGPRCAGRVLPARAGSRGAPRTPHSLPALRGLDEDRFARLQVPASKHAVACGRGVRGCAGRGAWISGVVVAGISQIDGAAGPTAEHTPPAPARAPVQTAPTAEDSAPAAPPPRRRHLQRAPLAVDARAKWLQPPAPCRTPPALTRGPGGLQRGNGKHSCADGTVVSVSGRSRGCEWPRYSQRRRVLEDAAVGGNQVELGARHRTVSTEIVE